MANLKVDAKGLDIGDVNAKIKRVIEGSDQVVVVNASDKYGLATGLSKGRITIEGDTGDYIGTLNTGAEITVNGCVGNYLGDNMTKGKIIVNGNAGYGAGQYCYGGLIAIRGNTGDFSATMNKGAIIVIGGNVGNEAATYMVAGDLIVIGNAGKNFGNFFIRGNIFIKGKWETLGHNVKEVGMSESDIERLRTVFTEIGWKEDPKSFKKLVPETDKPFYEKKKESKGGDAKCRY